MLYKCFQQFVQKFRKKSIYYIQISTEMYYVNNWNKSPLKCIDTKNNKNIFTSHENLYIIFFTQNLKSKGEFPYFS